MGLVVDLTIHGQQPIGDIHKLDLDTAKVLHDKLAEKFNK